MASVAYRFCYEEGRGLLYATPPLKRRSWASAVVFNSRPKPNIAANAKILSLGTRLDIQALGCVLLIDAFLRPCYFGP